MFGIISLYSMGRYICGTYALAKLMLIGVGCPTSIVSGEKNDGNGEDGDGTTSDSQTDCDCDGSIVSSQDARRHSIAKPMEKSWVDLASEFPWACFLSEGGYKKVIWFGMWLLLAKKRLLPWMLHLLNQWETQL